MGNGNIYPLSPVLSIRKISAHNQLCALNLQVWIWTRPSLRCEARYLILRAAYGEKGSTPIRAVHVADGKNWASRTRPARLRLLAGITVQTRDHRDPIRGSADE